MQKHDDHFDDIIDAYIRDQIGQSIVQYGPFWCMQASPAELDRLRRAMVSPVHANDWIH